MSSSMRKMAMPSLGEPLVVSGELGEAIALVTTEADWIATLTFGASTVRLIGPERTFVEPTAAYAVRHDTWVRPCPSHSAEALIERGSTMPWKPTGQGFRAAVRSKL